MSKAKIYITTFVDLVKVGYTPAAVFVDSSKDEAKARMKHEYLKRCEEEQIENPFEEGAMDYQLSNDFAYIFGKYYWDIFEKEIGLYCVN